MKTKFEIIKAEASDYELIQSLAYSIWPSWYASIISLDQIEFMLRVLYSPEALMAQESSGQHLYLAMENGNPIGFTGLTRHPEAKLKIDKLYLTESARGKGFGFRMIEFAENEAKKANSNRIFLNVNRFNDSFDFYKKVGFEVTEILDIPFGPFWLNDFILEKRIGQEI